METFFTERANGEGIRMRILLLVIGLSILNSAVYGQAMFPLSNKRIVTDVWCDLLATKLSADAVYWQNTWRKSMKKERNEIMVQLAHETSVYKNLCMK
jgi:hypothetical protein